MNDYPLISVITPCLNRAGLIGAAVESVMGQDYPSVEHIIVDGGSTDGTLDILRSYAHLEVISEPDRGVYDAFNKGIRRARGAIVTVLNSDDQYEPGVFKEIADRFAADPRLDICFGDADLFEERSDGGRRTIQTWDHFRTHELLPEDVTMRLPLINAHFFRRRLFDDFGLFDPDYRLAADIDFLLRLASRGLRCDFLGRKTYHYRQHAGSLTMGEIDYGTSALHVDESLSIARRFFEDPAIPRETRRACRRWHSRVSVYFAGHNLRRLQGLRALQYAARGWRHDPLWPWRFILFSAGYLGRKSPVER